MIKRLWFLPAREGGDTPWVQAALGSTDGIAPVRLVTCKATDGDLNDSPYQRIDMAWFADLEHLARFDQAADGHVAANTEGGPDGCTLAAEEHVLRGNDWLDVRWGNGGVRLKHVAIARRADGLSAEEFSQRWKAHAGSAGSAPIPDSARGLAYAQNHPLRPQPTSRVRHSPSLEECPYDAVNEVWFEDPDQLRERVLWLAENLPEESGDPLFGERCSLAVEETVLMNSQVD